MVLIVCRRENNEQVENVTCLNLACATNGGEKRLKMAKRSHYESLQSLAKVCNALPASIQVNHGACSMLGTCYGMVSFVIIGMVYIVSPIHRVLTSKIHLHTLLASDFYRES